MKLKNLLSDRLAKRALSMLERGNIVKGKMEYSERDAYREYEFIKKGEELAKKLMEEP